VAHHPLILKKPNAHGADGADYNAPPREKHQPGKTLLQNVATVSVANVDVTGLRYSLQNTRLARKQNLFALHKMFYMKLGNL